MSTGRLGELREEVGANWYTFLHPFLKQVDPHVDVRLVGTLANLVPVVLKRHDRSPALLLSQLGDDVEGEGHGSAGTKRIDNLLKTTEWQAREVGDDRGAEAKKLVSQEAALVPEKRARCILDGSVSAKPESSQLEGRAPINSAKARRLRRPRPHLGKGLLSRAFGAAHGRPGLQLGGHRRNRLGRADGKTAGDTGRVLLLSAGGPERSPAPGLHCPDSHR